MAKTTAETREVTARDSGGVRKGESERYTRPPVDIYEDSEGITLEADMPGVSGDRLTLHVDNDSLIVKGEASIEMPGDMEALYADVRATRYRRSFTLSSELETEAIEASLKDGVLRVHIPKRAEVRPRKIEVRVE